MSNTTTCQNDVACEDAPLLMRAIEVAKALGLSKSKIHMLILDGTLPHVRFGRSVRVPRAALVKFIEDQTTTAPTDPYRSPNLKEGK